MVALSNQEIVDQLQRLNITVQPEVDRYVEEYVDYRNKDNKGDHEQ